MKKTNKQLFEQKVREVMVEMGVLNTSPKKIIKESMDNDELVSEISNACNFDVDEIFHLFVEVFKNCNHSTEAKYIGRLAADILRSGGIEKTKFYKANIY